ncbi:hypothetical protein F0562_028967 [Nyssa sinensis]|uniref:C3H1-type domain-containing protein n=1 Tax=Nyssa sinensis TaxID=561372 RepID=A0A5J5B1C8_9ASTE|nr:hypothetical protein F0562_028967 [Nyssa sinensis]
MGADKDARNLGCNKGAESRTAYCKAHGGGRRCQHLGCTKSAEGRTDYCIAHGGGRRCGHPVGCTKAARGKSGLCIKHGGGKRCKVEGCTRSAEGQIGLCISHGGGRRCQSQGCTKGAQGSTLFCKAHGGGKRCIFAGCTKGAEGSTPLCKGHGGGKRCLFDGGGICPKSVHGGTDFCVSHGGGKRCCIPGCTKSARGRTDCCVRHGGGKRCRFENCGKSAQGSTDFCKAHGGGKRCNWGEGKCEKFARGKNGLCAAHSSMVQERENNKRAMIGPGLFHGLVPVTLTAGSSFENNYSSSGASVDSESIDSLEKPSKRHFIPHQLAVSEKYFMEGLYAISSSQVQKLEALNGNVSPINAHKDNHQFFVGGGRYHCPSESPRLDSYASVDSSYLENFDSTLVRYLRSGSPVSASSGDTPKYRSMISNPYHRSNSNTSGGSSGFGSRGSASISPLSAIENLQTPPSRSPPVFKTPVKVEEDVLVMDGILVASVPSARARSSSSSDSGGSSSSGNNSFYKTEICRPWEDSGSCRYGSKCQFAHGKEELRPTRFLNKSKSEAQTCKSFTSSGSCTYGSKCRFVHHQVMAAVPPIEPPPPPPPPAVMATPKAVSPIKSEQASASPIESAVATTQRVSALKSDQVTTTTSSSSSIGCSSTDWSPQDDGIEVALPPSVSTGKTPSREDLDAYTQSVLYGPVRRKRLPVFAEICPE